MINTRHCKDTIATASSEQGENVPTNEIERLRDENKLLKAEIDLLQRRLRGELESKESMNQSVTNMFSSLGSAVKDRQEKLRNDLAPFAKTIKTQRTAFAQGRQLAVKKRQEIATTKKATLIKAIASLFDTPDKPGWAWSNPKITDYLLRNDYGYSATVIRQTVNLEAARHRKTRRVQQASKLLNR